MPPLALFPELRGRLRELGRLWPAAPGALGVLLGWASYGGGLVDDAYISLVYARNLAEGRGLVFHPVLEPTEGYSNLLWILALTPGLGLGLPGAALAQGLGLLCTALAVGLVALRVGGARGAAVGLAISASPIVGYWAGRGLEGGLVTLLLVLGVLRLGSLQSWLCFGLLGVARVEGVVWGALAVLRVALVERRLPRPPELALWLGPFAAQLGLRALLYGSLAPAPTLAKLSEGVGSSLERGLGWLAQVGVGAPLAVLALGAALYWISRDLRALLAGPAPWAALGALGLVLFGVAVGGDWMPNLRWLQPAVPLVWFALGVAAPGWRALVPLALLSMAIDLQTGVFGAGQTSTRSVRAALETLELGPRPPPVHPAHLIVLETLPEDEVVLLPDVGQLAWMTGNPVLDPQGLTWASLARVMRAGWQGPEGEARLAGVQETLERLRPALIGIPIRGGRSAAGPVGAVSLGGARDEPLPWFDAGWERWREEPYGAGGSIRYYLRRDLGEKLGKEARLRRVRRALELAPELQSLRTRESWALRQLGRSDEATAAEQGLDPRARRIPEIWSR